jgi:FkbM family methyltransferase
MAIAAWWGVFRSLIIYYGQPWKAARMRRFYADFVPEGGLAFDVGAHVGNRTRCWTGLGAKVVAVEPQPKLLSVLGFLFGGRSTVAVEPVALGSESGRLQLRINTRNPTITTLSEDWVETFGGHPDIHTSPFDAVADVEVTTLDALIETHGVPDFCKIDVEGFEDKVLEGLSQPIAALSFEAFPLDIERSLRCIERLCALGEYRFRTVRAETFRWVEPDWVDAETMVASLKAATLNDGSADVYAARRSVQGTPPV